MLLHKHLGKTRRVHCPAFSQEHFKCSWELLSSSFLVQVGSCSPCSSLTHIWRWHLGVWVFPEVFLHILAVPEHWGVWDQAHWESPLQLCASSGFSQTSAALLAIPQFAQGQGNIFAFPKKKELNLWTQHVANLSTKKASELSKIS